MRGPIGLAMSSALGTAPEAGRKSSDTGSMPGMGIHMS
jgi:hypothetical protein